MLWRTDGTAAGTVELFDPGAGPYVAGSARWEASPLDASPGSPLIFTLGSRVWSAGPQPGSQRLLGDFAPGVEVSNPVVAGGKVFFIAGDAQAPYTRRLYVSADGRSPAAPVFAAAFGGAMAAANGVLYFAGNNDPSSAADQELWRSDGTAAGTYRVKDV